MLSRKNIRLIVTLLSVSLLLGLFLLLINTSVELYCISLIITSVLIPIIATRFLLGDIQVYFHSRSRPTGAVIGLITGAIPATEVVITSIISISMKGGDQTAPFGNFAFATVITSFIVGWFCLLILSAITGLLTSIRIQKK